MGRLANKFLTRVSRDGAGDVLFVMSDDETIAIADRVFQQTVSGNNYIVDMQVTGVAGASFDALNPPLQHRSVPLTTSITGSQLDTITQIRFNRGGVFQTFNVGDFLSQTANEIVIQLAPIAGVDVGDWYVVADDASADDAPTGLIQQVQPLVAFDPVTSHPESTFPNGIYRVTHPVGAQEYRAFSTTGRSSGKYYWTSVGPTNHVPGFILGAPSFVEGELGQDANSWGVESATIHNNGIPLGMPGVNIFGMHMLLDLDNFTAEFFPEGIGYTLGDVVISIPPGTYYPAVSTYDDVNGQGQGYFDPNTSIFPEPAGFVPWDSE